MPFTGTRHHKVLKRHQGMAKEALDARPSGRISGVNQPGVQGDCTPSNATDRVIPCDLSWHTLTFGHYYIRSQEAQRKARPPGAPLLFHLTDKPSLDSAFYDWANGGTLNDHAANQATAISAIEQADPDLWFRMSAWAGRPGRVFGGTRKKWARVGRKEWRETEVGPSRTSPDGNIHPAEDENSRENWRRQMERELRKKGVPENELERQVDEAEQLWGPKAPHVQCSDDSCYLEQKVDLGEGPKEPVHFSGWDVSANAVVPFQGAAGGIAGISEVAVCIRAKFRCLPPLEPPPAFPRSSPLYFSSRQDEFASYDEFLEWWWEQHPFPYRTYSMGPSPDRVQDRTVPDGGAQRIGLGCGCAGCRCGREGNQRAGRPPLHGVTAVAWADAIGQTKGDAFWDAAIHYHVRMEAAATPSVVHEHRSPVVRSQDRTANLSGVRQAGRAPQREFDQVRQSHHRELGE